MLSCGWRCTARSLKVRKRKEQILVFIGKSCNVVLEITSSHYVLHILKHFADSLLG
jgi:hypothetical protein